MECGQWLEEKSFTVWWSDSRYFYIFFQQVDVFPQPARYICIWSNRNEVWFELTLAPQNAMPSATPPWARVHMPPVLQKPVWQGLHQLSLVQPGRRAPIHMPQLKKLQCIQPPSQPLSLKLHNLETTTTPQAREIHEKSTTQEISKWISDSTVQASFHHLVNFFHPGRFFGVYFFAFCLSFKAISIRV